LRLYYQLSVLFFGKRWEKASSLYIVRYEQNETVSIWKVRH